MSFITDEGTYCYNVMPFGLKNAGPTFQKMINKVFAKQIGRNMEAYIDNTVVKSEKAEEHVANLEDIFNVLWKFKVKLNPKKYIFGVVAGKFLGFMVSQWGIKAKIEKIKAIIEMKPLSLIKAIQKLNSKITTLNYFKVFAIL